MIRDVVVHLLNEQPIVADTFEMPSVVDTGLVCTNLRTLDGRRPVFVDRSDSTFFFPYHNIRFIEMPSTGGDAPERPAPADPAVATAPVAADDEPEIDEEFLRRIREA